ncbi:hypothetical protein DDV21_010945 [Streptococcus chenjunshii]|uniref:Uncharacterized protein n=1 Tax=Streptococcus chenjunshii TaxID=2173853 RepID=A0A372KJ05_9STRE|nr:DUF3958 family protein [Streptococcus chenjunshii]AXQ79541.1 hypothetical protein DDV21_010945 [Streptococcus chenjunshii]RFU51456.1 hypothetical protein DDV22_03000 [Streptococcus chenjunshii]RFU52230.1 hypothetical protein DDV23_10765 [Streptococcus chenjunshii]
MTEEKELTKEEKIDANLQLEKKTLAELDDLEHEERRLSRLSDQVANTEGETRQFLQHLELLPLSPSSLQGVQEVHSDMTLFHRYLHEALEKQETDLKKGKKELNDSLDNLYHERQRLAQEEEKKEERLDGD